MPDLIKRPRKNTSVTGDNKDDEIDGDNNNINSEAEYLALVNRCNGDGSNNEKKEKKVDQTPMEVIRKFWDMIKPGFLYKRKHGIFNDNNDDDNDDDDNKANTNTNAK